MDQFGAMVALARLLGAEDPDGVAQEAFLKVYARWKSLRDPAAAPAYLRRTVINLSKNSLRHRMVRRHHGERSREAPTVPSAEVVVLARHDVATVLTAVAGLPRRRREALVLRHWLGLSYQEIADALGVSAASARSLASRALSDLESTVKDTQEQS